MLLCVAVCCSVLQCAAGVHIRVRPVCDGRAMEVRVCGVMQCVAVCCGVLQYVAMCCSVLQCVALCCSVLQCVVGIRIRVRPLGDGRAIEVCECGVMQCAAVRCSVLQYVAECCSVMQYFAVCCGYFI